MEAWYADLNAAKQYLIQVDPKLQLVFDTVDASGFELHTMIKAPFPALIAAIIGQRISYQRARSLRQQLYLQIGSNFTPGELANASLEFLGPRTAQIIRAVTEHIVATGVDLSRVEGIESLRCIPSVTIGVKTPIQMGT